MSTYKPDADGIKALRATASQLEEEATNLSNQCDAAIEVAESKRETLGPHASSLTEAIEAIKDEVGRDSEAIKKTAAKLERIAVQYQRIVDNDRFRGIAGN